MSLKFNGWFPIIGRDDSETKSQGRSGAETGEPRTGGGHGKAGERQGMASCPAGTLTLDFRPPEV